MQDAWRLSLGTLTALRVGPPSKVDRRIAGQAMLLAPLAVVPLGVVVGLVLWIGRSAGLGAFAVAAVAVGALALGSRAFHLDGLADTADGLTASYDRQRSLDVMKSGAAGPAGMVAIVVVLLVQVGSLSKLVYGTHGPVLAAVLVCVSRVALTSTCRHGVIAARPDGLGSSFTQSVSRVQSAVVWVAAAAITSLVYAWCGLGWSHGAGVVLVSWLAVELLVRRASSRLGGVTGDVFGAAIEIVVTILLLGVTTISQPLFGTNL